MTTCSPRSSEITTLAWLLALATLVDEVRQLFRREQCRLNLLFDLRFDEFGQRFQMLQLLVVGGDADMMHDALSDFAAFVPRFDDLYRLARAVGGVFDANEHGVSCVSKSSECQI